MRVELSRLIKAEQMMRMVRQLLSLEAITCVRIVGLEVEDVEVLRKETIGVDKRAKAPEGYQRLNDENLLRDLSEPAGDSQAVFSVPKNHQ